MGQTSAQTLGRHPVVEGALRTAAALTGMEVVLLTRFDNDRQIVENALGELPGLGLGDSIACSESLCARMLDGAPRAVTDMAQHPAYADVPARQRFGIKSYVGVPVLAADGTVVGTLCAIDRGEVVVDEAVLGVMEELAGIVAPYLSDNSRGGKSSGIAIRRRAGRWAVDTADQAGPGEADSLVEAIVLADLLSRDLQPLPRPPRGGDDDDEVDRLRVAVRQLEHALSARVVVEQAIGVLSERLSLAPREAFQRLRQEARSRQRRVHEMAQDVIASVTSDTETLPPSLRHR